ncbi:glycosyltransferase family 2 protein [Vibrio parahaemolyticus]|nr:glycosyltransferase family 2 protein [Vibrio parahaemolyticus]
MNKNKVTVVIPVYNRSHIVGRTLNSVAAQTYKNIEIIVVDDCSSDSVERLCCVIQTRNQTS